MSKPPPRLLRSMPQAKQAAKAIHGAIHTSSSVSTSVSTSAVIKRTNRDLIDGLSSLNLGVGPGASSDNRDGDGLRGTDGPMESYRGERSVSTVRIDPLDIESSTRIEHRQHRPGTNYHRRIHAERPRGAHSSSASTVPLRHHHTHAHPHTHAHAHARRYNTAPPPPTTRTSFSYIPNPLINCNPSPFTFPFVPPPPNGPNAAYTKWFDQNPSASSSSASTSTSSSTARPPSPPSPSRSPSPRLNSDSDLPSSNPSFAFVPPADTGPSTFTLATCIAVQHQGHVLAHTSVGNVSVKGKGRAIDTGPDGPPVPLGIRNGKSRDQFRASGSSNGGGAGPGGEEDRSVRRGGLREGEKMVLEFRPGAYGIPKKRYASTSSGSHSSRSKTTSGHHPGHQHQQHPHHPTTTLSTSLQIGEDAYYTHPLSLGIADGVGGWSSSRNAGVRSRADPGRFSLLLMGFCEDEVRGWESGKEGWMIDGREGVKGSEGSSNLAFGSGSGTPSRPSLPPPPPPRPPASGQTWMFDLPSPPPPTSSTEAQHDEWSNLEEGIVHERVRKDLCPVEVMQRGYEKCLASVKEEGLFGSATCLLAVLINDELRVANLGDCAIVVIREGEIVFRTEEMQHSFNFPLQLGTNSRDEPMKDAQLFKVKVQKDDIVIMCSDGLVDNLFDEDILDIIASFAPPSSPVEDTNLPPFSPQGVSEALCRAAKSASEEPGSPSPFMCKALDEGIDFLGGKKDDISVLVAVVQHRDREGVVA